MIAAKVTVVYQHLHFLQRRMYMRLYRRAQEEVVHVPAVLPAATTTHVHALRAVGCGGNGRGDGGAVGGGGA